MYKFWCKMLWLFDYFQRNRSMFCVCNYFSGIINVRQSLFLFFLPESNFLLYSDFNLYILKPAALQHVNTQSLILLFTWWIHCKLNVRVATTWKNLGKPGIEFLSCLKNYLFFKASFLYWTNSWYFFLWYSLLLSFFLVASFYSTLLTFLL